MLLYLILFLVTALHLQHSCDGTKIAFGSCSKVDERQPMWHLIESRQPNLWVWGGDNVYSDVRISKLKFSYYNAAAAAQPLMPGERRNFHPRTREEHQAMYDAQNLIPEYASLVSKVPIVGTWDDHDCGINDADKHFQHKEERQELHLNFLHVPKNDPRRTRKGVYASHIVGGNMKVILLDVRYHRDPWSWHPGGMPTGTTLTSEAEADARPEARPDMLGAEQWTWLEQELSQNLLNHQNIEVTLIVSGFQILPIVYSAASKHETWHHFKKSRQRLFNLMSTSATPVVLLSGDVHYAEMSESFCYDSVEAGEGGVGDGGEAMSPPRRLLEFTSSGLTHAWAGPWNWPKPVPVALLFRLAWWAWSKIGVNPWRVEAYPGLNFGMIELVERKLIMRAIGVDNQTKFEMVVSLDELLGGSESRSGRRGRVVCRPRNGVPTSYEISMAKCLFVSVILLLILLLVAPFLWCCCCCYEYKLSLLGGGGGGKKQQQHKIKEK